MTIIKGYCGGMTFRGTTPSTYYFEVCQGGQYLLILYFPNSNTVLVNDSSAAVNTGFNQSNLIAVEAVGNYIDLYVNHRKVKGINDSTGSNGAINLAISADGPSTDIAFTNARVWTP